MRLRFFLALNGLLFLICPSANAQAVYPRRTSPPPQFTDITAPNIFIPFDTWLNEGERTEIPWDLTIVPAELSYYLRLRAGVRARVATNWLRRYPGEHSMVFAVRIAGADGRWLSPESSAAGRTAEVLPPGASVQFLIEPFLLPGDYTIAIILYDQTTGFRNITRRRLVVSGTSDPFLVQAWRNLPAVEFMSGNTAGLDRLFVPDLSPLNIAVANRRPVSVEVIVNFSTSEEFAGSRRAHRSSTRTLLPVLRAFSQLRLSHGTVRLTVVDVSRRLMLLEEPDISRVQWPGLRAAALEKRNPLTVDASVLAAHLSNAVFFRDLLASRLTPPPAAPAPAGGSTSSEFGGGPAPRRIIILIRSPQVFPPGTDFTPLALPASCDCTIYDFRLPILSENVWDELDRVFKPLAPRKFTITDPKEFRKAFLLLLADLSS